MADLGVGKNMVTALRFWAEAAGVVQSRAGRWDVTEFGKAIFGPGGLDPFFDDVTTLWLVHWNIASAEFAPALFAWDVFFGRWLEPEFTRSEALSEFRRLADASDRKVSDVTLAQHFDVFLHTYVAPTSRRTVAEDSLDSPLTELELFNASSDRRTVPGGEQVFTFPRGERPTLSDALFAFCVGKYWKSRRPHELTLTFSDVCSAIGSVGQIFRLTEAEVRRRIERIENATAGVLTYRFSHGSPVILSTGSIDRVVDVRRLYPNAALVSDAVKWKPASRRLSRTPRQMTSDVSR